MKRFVVAASAAQREANAKADKIYRAMQTLFNLLEDTPDGFVDENDLSDLYDALLEDLPALKYAINSGSVMVPIRHSEEE